jgi:hypothetical protein
MAWRLIKHRGNFNFHVTKTVAENTKYAFMDDQKVSTLNLGKCCKKLCLDSATSGDTLIQGIPNETNQMRKKRWRIVLLQLLQVLSKLVESPLEDTQ